MLGMQLVVQDFADDGLRVFPGMFAHGAVVANCRPDFLESTDIVCVHYFPLLFLVDTD